MLGLKKVLGHGREAVMALFASASRLPSIVCSFDDVDCCLAWMLFFEVIRSGSRTFQITLRTLEGLSKVRVEVELQIPSPRSHKATIQRALAFFLLVFPLHVPKHVRCLPVAVGTVVEPKTSSGSRLFLSREYTFGAQELCRHCRKVV